MSTTPLRRISAVAAIVAACGTATAVPAFAAANPAVTGLRAGDLSDQLGIEDTTPPLTWQLTNSGTNITQDAYQIQAATSADGFDHPDLWDTGRVASADQRVDYAGKALGSRTRVYWRVRVWTTRGGVSAWSDPAWFETGLTSANDWSGQWITHPDWRFKEKRPDPIVVRLPETTARYVRINVTKLGLPMVENLPDKTYRLQLAELEVRDSSGTNLAANMSVTSNDTGNQVNHKYLPKYLTDGTETTDQELAGWSSSAYPSDDVSAKPITLTVDLKSAKTFDQVLLFPRTDVPVAGDKVPFAPVDYSVSTADDVGGTFTTRQTVTGQEPPRSPVPEAMPIFAKDFSLPSGIRSARLYVAGEGVYEAALNGRQVGDAVLEPGNTDVTDQVPYATYDVTKLLREGDNAISMKLGNGTANVISTVDRYRKFNGTQSDPELMAQLEVTLADGGVRRIVSGSDWQTTLGGTTFSNWYGGEDFDARREPSGWERPGADRKDWQQAVEVPSPGGARADSDPPTGAHPLLTGRLQEPVRVQETVQGTKVGSGTGYQVWDLGRNIAGWAELTIQAPAGTTVRMYPSESLTNGRENQSTSNVGAPIWDEYTTRSDGTETWHPHFSYNAIRYVELRGVPDGATVSVRGLALHADNASAGSFSSSNDVINGTHTLIQRAIANNMQSILTDCPSREKLGWLEQDQLVFGALVDNYDLAAQLRKVVRDMAEAQTDTGLIPSTVPDYTVLAGAYRDDPNWGGAFVVVPWNLYETYGDADTMATYYSAMRKYASYLEARAVNGLTDYSLGDWYTPDKTFPKYVSGTYGYWRVLDTMAKIAGALGRTDDAAAYRAKADASAKALADKYYDATTGTFAGGGQGAEAIALDMGAVPSDQRQRLLDHLISSITAAGYHLLLGEISLPSVFRVLPDDVIYKVATQTTSPSLGYQVVHGNTTLGESWDGGSGQSQDHFMLGAIDSWFTGNLAGIRQAPGSTGFRTLLIAPSVVGDLTHAEGRYRTPFGEARSEWTKSDDGDVRLKVTVPPGSTAEVHVPGSGAVHQVGSGVWVFHAK